MPPLVAVSFPDNRPAAARRTDASLEDDLERERQAGPVTAIFCHQAAS